MDGIKSQITDAAERQLNSKNRVAVHCGVAMHQMRPLSDKGQSDPPASDDMNGNQTIDDACSLMLKDYAAFPHALQEVLFRNIVASIWAKYIH